MQNAFMRNPVITSNASMYTFASPNYIFYENVY